jgi:ketosteroid isomerase-like protein
MSPEDEVRRVSRQFYKALNHTVNGDAGPMADIWSHSPTVTTMHPIGGREVGWDAVRASYEKIAKLVSEGKIELRDQLICFHEDMAFEFGVEHGQVKLAGLQITIEHRVTNIYKPETGVWKIIHHHTDMSPAIRDVFS